MTKDIGRGYNAKALRYDVIMIAVSSVLLVAASVLGSVYTEMSKWLRLLMYLVPFVTAGAPALVDALDRLLHGKLLDEAFLISAAAIIALCMGEYPAAVAVMLFYRTGKTLERFALAKRRHYAAGLSDIRPSHAWAEVNGELKKLDPSRVPAGAVIAIAPGERIPLDGVILDGSSTIDTSPLTGRKAQHEVSVGEAVVSGCMNLSGALRVRVSVPFRDSTVVKVIELAERSCGSVSRQEAFITRFSRIYTPLLAVCAVLLAVIPAFVDGNWSEWTGRALVLLAVSGTGALFVSVPLSFFGGIYSAARSGALIKSADRLETLAAVGTAVLDKTGTVTEGSFSVTGIEPVGISSAELISLAAGAEGRSAHPIAFALRRACPQLPARNLVSDVHEIPGRGVSATVCGREVLVGNAALMNAAGIRFSEVKTKKALVYVAVDGSYSGYILIDDRIKDGAKETVRELHALGVENIVMLTGDADATGRSVGNSLGVNDIMTELLPEDKLVALQELLREKHDGSLMFIGDGISDAAVIARADVGAAIGVLGKNEAMDFADVILMDDDIRAVPLAMRTAKRTVAIAKQNTWLIILGKLALIALGAAGTISLWPAVFADTLILVIAVINSIRTLKIPQ